MARTGDDLVHLEARKLSAFTGLGSLRHLDLYLFGIHQVFGGHSETSRCHLLGLATERDAVERVVKAVRILASFARIAPCAQLVHRKRHCLVGFLADGAERHGSRHEMFHYILYRLHFFYRNGVALEGEEVAQENGMLFLVRLAGVFLELGIASRACGELKGTDGFRVPGMFLSVFPVRELSDMRQ